MLNGEVKKLHNKILKNNKTIAVAESCTGGVLSSLLTKYPGASTYFLLGVISYSNKSKIDVLNISNDTIEKYGAVSSETAILMAKNIREKINSDFGISITGIASEIKINTSDNKKPLPKGTVFIGFSTKEKSFCNSYLFKGDRDKIRKSATLEAVRLLSKNI